jgi:glycolate oxidase FAD binding subunit
MAEPPLPDPALADPALADPALAALRAAHGSAAPAGPGDAVAGVRPRYRVAPDSTEATGAVLAAAAGHGLCTVVRGGASTLDWGTAPSRVDLVLDTGGLSGVLEHVAGDLVVAVRAGTRLTDLQDRLGAAGQQLALDNPYPAATVGGIVATAASGPRRLLYGTPRDLLIGVTLARADGVVAKAGGKVVKNVAGYDLGKLLTGSYGTLGVVTECVFRLHPLPAATAVVRRSYADPAAAGTAVAAVLGAQVVPSAIEVDAPAGGDVEIAVLLEGVPAGVAARQTATAALLGGGATTGPDRPDWWAAYPWHDGDIGMKLSVPVSTVPALLTAARAAADQYGAALAVRGSAGTGVLYAGPATAELVGTLRTAAGEHGHAMVLCGQTDQAVDRWGPVPGLELMRRVKAQFDPAGLLAPGRFVGGI